MDLDWEEQRRGVKGCEHRDVSVSSVEGVGGDNDGWAAEAASQVLIPMKAKEGPVGYTEEGDMNE